ncbi:TetR/AcrR family transcriptional regulator C-terminal domain-containing protein [Nonomuraea angiospora]|uniref:TetR/AcrR family transcriptional regulator n=1 Tax=Nonomuraea angiospora TaxID=46172 RepID=UPI0033D762B6
MASSADQQPPRRRAWGSLSQAQIVSVALEIARTEGMEALTVRRLAADLGASRMALYRHVADKDALVDLVMNAIAEHDLVPPGIDEGRWPHRLRLLAAAMRRQLAAYPGMVDVLMTRANHGPGALKLVETILAILADAGLDERQAARHYMIFIDLVLGRLHRELHGDPVSAHRTASLLALAEQAEDHPRLRAAEPHLRAVSAEEVFEAELDMLIEAVRAAAS